MGGGGAMRAAVKAAGIGLQNTGIHGLPDNFSIRRAIRPQASATAVEDSGRLQAAASGQANPAVAWELDDWDFAGYDVDEKPRVVFGPAPSLQETKEATSQLADALDLMYFSPKHSGGSSDSVSEIDDKHSVVSESKTPHADTNTCAFDQNYIVSPAPNHALQAFSFLRENPAAQAVVASIAADPNVWNAVEQNAAVKEYLQNEKKFMEDEDHEEPHNASANFGNAANLFAEFAENVKVTVVGWVNNMSSFFHELFAETDAKTSSGPSSWSPSSNSVFGTLFALASMVIMVVVLKRG